MSGTIIPWNWRKKRISVAGSEEHPILQVQRHLTRVLNDLNNVIPEALAEPIQQLGERWGSFSPNVNVVRSDKELLIAIELPGMDENDVELTLVPDGLVIRGEKRPPSYSFDGLDEHYTEASYGEFERIVTLRLDEIEQDQVDASSAKGIVTIRLPFKEATKRPLKSQIKKVSIRSVS